VAKKKTPSKPLPFGKELLKRTTGITLGTDKAFKGMTKGQIFKTDLYSRLFGIKPSGAGGGSPLGMAGAAMGKGARKGAAVSGAAMPTMEQPQTVSNVSNPSIATITSQLEQLVATANSIGIITREQQDILLSQIAQANRVAKENQLEEDKTSSLIPEGPDNGLTSELLVPITDAMNSLNDRLESLIGVINDQIDAGGDGPDSTPTKKGKRGKGKINATKIPKGKVLKEGFTEGVDKTGRRFFKNQAGKFASAEAALMNKPSLWAKLTSGIGKSTVGTALKTAGTALASTRIAQLIGTGLSKAAATKVGQQAMNKSVLAVAVKRVAGPLIERGLGKTVLRSIPIIGAGIGIASAASRLVKGDVVGAGLDLISGLGGPMTAIPAFIATLARDSYSGVFGIQPEEDPDFGPRMTMLKEVLEDIVKEYLGQAIKTKAPTPAPRMDDVQIPTMTMQRPESATSTPEPRATLSGSPATPTPSPTSGGTSGAAMSSSESGPASEMQPPAADTGAQLSVAEQQPSQASHGEFINAQSVPVANEWEQFGYDVNREMFFPQTRATPRGGADGIGAIPDPVYRADNIENIKRIIYFNY